MPGLANLDKVKQEFKIKPETKIIYHTNEVVKNPYSDEEMKYIKRGLKAYMSTFTHNLARKKGDIRDSDNFDDLVSTMKLYNKVVGHYYFNEKLYKLLEIEKGEDLEK